MTCFIFRVGLESVSEKLEGHGVEFQQCVFPAARIPAHSQSPEDVCAVSTAVWDTQRGQEAHFHNWGWFRHPGNSGHVVVMPAACVRGLGSAIRLGVVLMTGRQSGLVGDGASGGQPKALGQGAPQQCG